MDTIENEQGIIAFIECKWGLVGLDQVANMQHGSHTWWGIEINYDMMGHHRKQTRCNISHEWNRTWCKRLQLKANMAFWTSCSHTVPHPPNYSPTYPLTANIFIIPFPPPSNFSTSTRTLGPPTWSEHLHLFPSVSYPFIASLASKHAEGCIHPSQCLLLCLQIEYFDEEGSQKYKLPEGWCI